MIWFDIIAGALIVLLIIGVVLRPFRRWIEGKIDRSGPSSRPPIVLLPPPKKRREGDNTEKEV